MMKKNTARRGRPTVGLRKKSIPIMLDPRYIEVLKNEALQRNEGFQDLLRKALYESFGNPQEYGIG